MDRNVLVVDDEPDLVYYLKRMLEREGFHVMTALSGRECLEEMDKGFKGVILMDIMMPNMDGWDTVKEIVDRGLIEGNIISMLTAKPEPDIKLMELKEYVLDYITKPVDKKTLLSIVKGYSDYFEG